MSSAMIDYTTVIAAFSNPFDIEKMKETLMKFTENSSVTDFNYYLWVVKSNYEIQFNQHMHYGKADLSLIHILREYPYLLNGKVFAYKWLTLSKLDTPIEIGKIYNNKYYMGCYAKQLISGDTLMFKLIFTGCYIPVEECLYIENGMMPWEYQVKVGINMGNFLFDFSNINI